MLPFPRVHYYVAGALALTIVAFAPSYFLRLPEAPFAHHLHGGTATLWLVLLATQNWTIHTGHRRLHVLSGIGSLILVPLFVVGGLLATQMTLLKDTPFNAMFGTPLAVADLLMSVLFSAFYCQALRHRRQPQLHARYMLATLALLMGPALARLFANYVPGLMIRSLEQLPRFGSILDISMAMAAALFLLLALRDARSGKPVLPFAAAVASVVASYVGYRWVGATDAWRTLAPTLAELPSGAWTSAGLVLGASASLIGWYAPAQRPKTSPGGAISTQPA